MTASPWVKRAVEHRLPVSDRTGLVRLVAGEPTIVHRQHVREAVRHLLRRNR